MAFRGTFSHRRGERTWGPHIHRLNGHAPLGCQLIDQALQADNRDKLWLTLAPFGAITITLVLVVFIGESVREAFDPKQYAKYE